MPKEFKAGCERPASENKQAEAVNSSQESIEIKEEVKKMITVGKKAPDFSAPGFYQGKFVNVDLAEYAGKWVMLCFYPGDFTFV